MDLSDDVWAGKKLSLAKLEQIRKDCNACDREVDIEMMENWSISEAKEYFRWSPW